MLPPPTPFGPPGGDVADVAPVPGASGVLLAGLDPYPGRNGAGGMFRSTDGGATWARASSVPETVGVFRFAFGGPGTGVAYAATTTGLWKSSDAGATWSRMSYGSSSAYEWTRTVAVSRRNTGRIWTASGIYPNSLQRSTDGGATWSGAGPYNTGGITAIAIDPYDDAIMIVGGGKGVWVSTSGGSLWADRTHGLPAQAVSTVHYDGTRLIVGLRSSIDSPQPPQTPGLYASTDLGVTWTPLSDATWPSREVLDVAVDPTDADTLLVATLRDGVFRSDDGGATWQFPTGTQRYAARSVRHDAGTVWTGASGLAVMRSSDGGTTFEPSAQGMHALGTTSVALNPLDANDMAVAYSAGADAGGVWRTHDGGAQWQRQALPSRETGQVAYAADGVLHAAVQGTNGVGGVWRADANGGWTLVGPDLGTGMATGALALGHRDAALIYAVGYGGSDVGGVLWRSPDRGATWTLLTSPSTRRGWFTDIELLDDGADRQLFVSYTGATGEPSVVSRSSNAGTTWYGASNGWQTQRPIRLCARRGALPLPLGAADGRIKRWHDLGQSWVDIGTFTTTDTPIGCDRNDAYIADTLRVLRSGDGGATFTAQTGDLGRLAATDIVVRRGQLYVATAAGAYTAPAETIFSDGYGD